MSAAQIKPSLIQEASCSISDGLELEHSLANLTGMLRENIQADVGGAITYDTSEPVVSEGFTESENEHLSTISRSRVEDTNRVFSDWWQGSVICHKSRLKADHIIIRTANPTVQVIMLSIYDTTEYLNASLEAGAGNNIIKSTEIDTLANEIRRIAQKQDVEAVEREQ